MRPGTTVTPGRSKSMKRGRVMRPRIYDRTRPAGAVVRNTVRQARVRAIVTKTSIVMTARLTIVETTIVTASRFLPSM